MAEINKSELFLDAVAKGAAEVDTMTDNVSDDVALRISQLWQIPEERDPDLFSLLGAAVEETIDFYIQVPVYERDMDWISAVAAMMTACYIQAWCEFFGVDALTKMEQQGRYIEAAKKELELKDLKNAAKVGVGKGRFDNATKNKS